MSPSVPRNKPLRPSTPTRGANELENPSPIAFPDPSVQKPATATSRCAGRLHSEPSREGDAASGEQSTERDRAQAGDQQCSCQAGSKSGSGCFTATV